MKINKLYEGKTADKIKKDPRILKMLEIAFRHDGTLPINVVSQLGPKPTAEQVAEAWEKVLKTSLENTEYGDVSDGKFDEWLTRMYINGSMDYEDLNGEGGDALGAWKALSLRGLLKPEHQDFNRFKRFSDVKKAINSSDYSSELKRLKDQERIEQMKRSRKEIILINDERFVVLIPLNYGSCYTFNNAEGTSAKFCTGSSSGSYWFERYAKDGAIISVFDKDNPNSADGKWQIHAPTYQMNNATQDSNGDRRFAELFPGLLKRIGQAMASKANEINNESRDIVTGGYDVEQDISRLRREFPLSWASEDPTANNNNDEEWKNQPGTFLVTKTSSGQTARITGENLASVQQQVITRYPDTSVDDYTWELAEE